jgi:hypothetical protein
MQIPDSSRTKVGIAVGASIDTDKCTYAQGHSVSCTEAVHVSWRHGMESKIKFDYIISDVP